MASSASTNLQNHSIWHLDGFPLPRSVTLHQLDFMKTMELFPDDVWVVTYPRSGTTWMQQIIRCIRSQREDLPIDQAVPFLELANSNIKSYNVDISNMERPRAFKSHMTYTLLPCGTPTNTPCKYIYVARNPKDMAVSYFYHYFSTKSAENFTFDEFFSALFSGQVQYGDYFDHVLSWWEHKDDENILFMKYEDMKKDTRAAIIKIADFINVNLTEDAVESVLEKSSFSSMKQNPTTNYEWNPKDETHQDKTPTIRKGIVGGWKEHLTSTQSAIVDKLYCEKYKAIGLEFEFC